MMHLTEGMHVTHQRYSLSSTTSYTRCLGALLHSWPSRFFSTHPPVSKFICIVAGGLCLTSPPWLEIGRRLVSRKIVLHVYSVSYG